MGPGVLIEGADKALYKAKNESRDTCKMCSAEDMLDFKRLKNSFIITV
jgi:hypothetical protein